MNIDFTAWVGSACQRVRDLKIDGTISTLLPGHRGSGHVIRVENRRMVAQFAVWPTGQTESQSANVARDEHPLVLHADAADERGLDEIFERFLRVLIDKNAG